MTRDEMATGLEAIWVNPPNNERALARHMRDCKAIDTAVAEFRRTCEWTEDSDGIWTIGCIGGSSRDDRLHELSLFCNFCGGQLVERPYVEPVEARP